MDLISKTPMNKVHQILNSNSKIKFEFKQKEKKNKNSKGKEKQKARSWLDLLGPLARSSSQLAHAAAG